MDVLCLPMSGVEVTKEPKPTQDHICASCMNTVVQSFMHMQEEISQLKKENQKLQVEMEQLKKQQK